MVGRDVAHLSKVCVREIQFVTLTSVPRARLPTAFISGGRSPVCCATATSWNSASLAPSLLLHGLLRRKGLAWEKHERKHSHSRCPTRSGEHFFAPDGTLLRYISPCDALPRFAADPLRPGDPVPALGPRAPGDAGDVDAGADDTDTHAAATMRARMSRLHASLEDWWVLQASAVFG